MLDRTTTRARRLIVASAMLAGLGWPSLHCPKSAGQSPERQSSELSYPNAVLPSIAGDSLNLTNLRGKAATVLVSLSIDCPICSEYLPTLNRLAASFRGRGVNMVALDPNAGETLEAMADYCRENKVSITFVRDEGAKVCRQLGFSVTPEVCLFDAFGKPVYRGRIDDRYRAGGATPQQTGELEKALEAVVTGGNVAAPRTKPVGCPIQLTARPT